ncbi:MAG: hypothetical protein R2724_16555 [Bryobacterales bacterium]
MRVFEGGSLLLNSGMEPHPPHKHPEEGIHIAAEGSRRNLIEEQKIAKVSWLHDVRWRNRLHGIKNTGKTPLLFYC